MVINYFASLLITAIVEGFGLAGFAGGLTGKFFGETSRKGSGVRGGGGGKGAPSLDPSDFAKSFVGLREYLSTSPGNK